MHFFNILAYGICYGNGRHKDVKVSPQVCELGLFLIVLNHPHVIQPAECCTNAANIHTPAKHQASPYANIHPPAQLMSSIYNLPIPVCSAIPSKMPVSISIPDYSHLATRGTHPTGNGCDSRIRLAALDHSEWHCKVDITVDKKDSHAWPRSLIFLFWQSSCENIHTALSKITTIVLGYLSTFLAYKSSIILK